MWEGLWETVQNEKDAQAAGGGEEIRGYSLEESYLAGGVLLGSKNLPIRLDVECPPLQYILGLNTRHDKHEALQLPLLNPIWGEAWVSLASDPLLHVTGCGPYRSSG